MRQSKLAWGVKEMRSVLSWSVGVLLLCAAIAAAQSPIPVAFVGVEDESGYGGAVFKEQVAEVLTDALNATHVFAVRNLHGRLPEPLDAQVLAKVVEKTQAAAVARATVKRVSIRKPKRVTQVTVVLEVQLVPVRAKQVAFKSCAEGRADDPAEGRAVAKAVAKAATEAAKQLSTVVALRGQVLLPPVYSVLPATHYKDRDQLYERTVRISLDIASGVKVGSEVVILKQGHPIAAGRIVEVDIGSSLVALEKVTPGAKIGIGDEVLVTSIPQYAPKLPLPLQKEREYKRVEHDFAWALAIAGAVIGLAGD